MFGELTLKISECPSSKYKNQNVLNSDLNVPEFDLFRALTLVKRLFQDILTKRKQSFWSIRIVSRLSLGKNFNIFNVSTYSRHKKNKISYKFR